MSSVSDFGVIWTYLEEIFQKNIVISLLIEAVKRYKYDSK